MGVSGEFDEARLFDPTWRAEFLDLRESLHFLCIFISVKSLCLGQPKNLHVKEFLDFRLERLCDDLMDYALRVPSEVKMKDTYFFFEYYNEIFRYFEEYQRYWKMHVRRVKNRKIDSLLLRSLKCRNHDFDKFGAQIGISKSQSLDDIDQFIEDFLMFLQDQNLAVPLHSHWRCVYNKIATQVAAWQLPPGVPDEVLIATQPGACVEVLKSQLHWAANNGRIAEATRALGKLGAENWKLLSE